MGSIIKPVAVVIKELCDASVAQTAVVVVLVVVAVAVVVMRRT